MSIKNKKSKICALILSGSILLSGQQVYASNNTRSNLQERQRNLNQIENRIKNEEQNINSYQNQIKSIENKKSDVNSILSEIQDNRNAIEDQIKDLNANIQVTMNAIYQIDTQIIEITNDIKSKEEEIEELKIRIEENTKLLRERLRVSYKIGDADKVEILLTSDGITDFLSRSKMITTITDFDKKLIESLKRDRERIDTLIVELKGDRTSLEVSKDNSEKEKAYLENQKVAQDILLEKVKAEEAEKYTELEGINQEISNYQSELNQRLKEKTNLANQRGQLSTEIRRLENEIRKEEARIKAAEEERRRKDAEAARRRKAAAESKLEEASNNYGNVNNNYNSSGRFAWPTAATTITSRFGWRSSPLPGASSFHEGLDIAGPAGTPIFAAESGEVVKVHYPYPNQTYGGRATGNNNHVVIKHSNGISTAYLHMKSINVSVGQKVSRGQNIGTIGSTGFSTGPHLHFEVRINGRHVDPLPYLR